MKSYQKSSNYKKYHSKNLFQRYLINRFLKEISKEIENLSVDSLLDVGCGEGLGLEKLLRKHFPKKVYGVDINSNALKIAKNTLPNVVFEKGDIKNLRFKENIFDLVIALEVVEHVRDFNTSINELVRVSKKYILISVPWEPVFSLANLLRGKNINRFGRDMEHINYWNKRSFKKIFIDIEGIETIVHRTVFPWQIILMKKT